MQAMIEVFTALLVQVQTSSGIAPEDRSRWGGLLQQAVAVLSETAKGVPAEALGEAINRAVYSSS